MREKASRLIINISWFAVLMVLFSNLAAETVTVGYFDKKPIIFQDENNQPNGIVVDILEDISRTHDMAFAYRHGSFSEILEALVNHDIDLMVPLGFTSGRDSLVGYSVHPVISSWGTLYSSTDYPINSIHESAGKRIAYVKNSLFYNEFLDLTEKFEIECDLIAVKSYDAMFSGIIQGKYDGGVGDRLNIAGQPREVRYQLHSTVVFHPFEMYFAVSQPNNGQLIDAIDNYLSAGRNNPLSNYNKILEKWITGTAGYDAKVLKSFFILIGILILFFFFIFIIKIPKLRKKAGLDRYFSKKESINLLLGSLVLALIVWMSDSIIIYFWFNSEGFNLIDIITCKYDYGELLDRILYSSIIIISSIYISRLIEKMGQEKKKAEESAEKLRTTLHSIGDAVITTDLKGNIIHMNAVAEKLTGWKYNDALGKPLNDIFKIINARTKKTMESPVKRVLRSGKIVGLANHTLLKSKDGKEFQISDSAAPIINKDDEILGVVLVFRDVTEEYKLQEKVRINEDRLQKTMIAANDGMWDWDLKTNRVYFDPRYYTIAGYNVDDFPHKLEEFQKRVHPDDIDKVMEMAQRHLQGEVERFHIEFRFLKKDGSWIWILGRGVIVERDAQGVPTRFIGTHSDISGRKKSEEKLSAKTEELDNFFNTSLDLLCIADMDGQFIRLNKEWELTLGYSVKELEGQNFLDFVHPEDVSATIEATRELKNSREVSNFTNRYRTRNGYYRYIEWRSTPQNNLIYAAARDVTERIQSEKLIKEKNAELENYLYVASHDLRSPLVNIQGFTTRLGKHLKKIDELVTETCDNRDVRLEIEQMTRKQMPQSMDFIFNNVKKMDVLIKGLLQISRTGRAILTIRKVNMDQLLREVVNAHSFEIEQFDVTVNIGELPDCYGDKNLLNQLFSNLLSNSIKYRKRDEELIIDITAEKYQQKVRYILQDNGIGIEPKNLNKIWNVFFRTGTVAEETGEGIGLSIVKRIVDKHQGNIDVISEIGKGTQMMVDLPIEDFNKEDK